MTAILQSLAALPCLLELNMSCNKMGRRAAEAMQAYLSTTSACRLESLILRNAHIDDGEVRGAMMMMMMMMMSGYILVCSGGGVQQQL
jgi:hypothetical protein